MQASIRKTDHAVIQVGQSLGVRTDALIVDLSAQEETDLRAAFDQPHGLIYFNAGVVTFDPPPAPTPPDPQIAADKATVVAFMNATSGTATAVQRDDTLKAVIRYLRRRGDDA